MIIKGHGILWDPERKRPVARFVNGELDTQDARVIELASIAGLPPQGERPRPEPTSTDAGEAATLAGPRLEGMTKKQLADLAHQRGVLISRGAKVADIRAALLVTQPKEQVNGTT